MIAGKTNDEIMLMPKLARSYWYKKILPREKEEAMRVMSNIKRAKMSAAWTPKRRARQREFMMGKDNPARRPEVKIKIGIVHKDKILSEETKAQLSISATEQWEDPKHRIKIDESWTLERRSKHSEFMSGKNNPMYGMIGKNAANYIDGRSFLPYCHLFNKNKKEEVRNRWGRVCILTDLMRSTLGSESGLDDFEGYEIFNGRRNSVHHVRGDKMEGCNGKEMALVPLQGKFNVKKFDGLKLEDHPFYITLFLLKDVERKHREEMIEEWNKKDKF